LPDHSLWFASYQANCQSHDTQERYFQLFGLHTKPITRVKYFILNHKYISVNMKIISTFLRLADQACQNGPIAPLTGQYPVNIGIGPHCGPERAPFWSRLSQMGPDHGPNGSRFKCLLGYDTSSGFFFLQTN